MKNRYRTALALTFIAALAIGLSAAIFAFNAGTAGAQGTNPSYVTVQSSQTSVPEGGLAAFSVMRSGGRLNRPLTVQVKTWEPNHEDALGVNDTERFHDVTFARWGNVATLNVVALQDQRYDPPPTPLPHTLNAYGIHDSDENLIPNTTDDDGGADTDSQLDYTARTTGVHYISVGVSNLADSRDGNYGLVVTDVTP